MNDRAKTQELVPGKPPPKISGGRLWQYWRFKWAEGGATGWLFHLTIGCDDNRSSILIAPLLRDFHQTVSSFRLNKRLENQSIHSCNNLFVDSSIPCWIYLQVIQTKTSPMDALTFEEREPRSSLRITFRLGKTGVIRDERKDEKFYEERCIVEIAFEKLTFDKYDGTVWDDEVWRRSK